jgi:hypothetical protein
MTEADWMSATSPDEMLAYVEEHPEAASERKLRLLAAAWCRRVAYLLPDEAMRRGLDVLERYAEGTATPHEVSKVRRLATQAEKSGGSAVRALNYAATRRLEQEGLSKVCHAVASAEAGHMAYRTQSRGAVFAAAYDQAWSVASKAEADLIRECLGDPFRPVRIARSWLTWGNGTIASLAAAIYADRAFDRLPILGDALEEAGCDDTAILGHCRQAGQHVLGCWVLDRLLGKK